ncbi:MAG: glycerol-3-phosphate acyltransferase [Candidatus Lokiarchaeota archaeon]|nr:glycerol-3-phosphate acyltransferase [Candidatus Lokiarchaeota archaeon]
MESLEILLSIFSCIVGYFLGSVNPGYFFGKMKGIDIREHGTKNAGTSNTYKVLGLKYAAPTALFDTFKSLLMIYVATLLGVPLFFAHLSGIMTIVGHIFPFYMNFKGGQGVAAGTGMMLFYIISYFTLNFSLLYFLIFDMVLVAIFTYITRRGTILSLIVLPPFGYFIHVTYPMHPYNLFFWIILAHIMYIGASNVITRKTIQITDENYTGHKWRVLTRPFSILFVVFYVVFSQGIALLIIGIVSVAFIVLDMIRFLHKQTNVLLYEKVKTLFRKNEYQTFSSMTIFLTSFFITILVFPKEIAIAASTFLIFGDTFGKIFGLAFGKHKILNKTVEGTLAYFGCIMICSYVLYTLLDISPYILIFGGLSAPLIELFSMGMNDNITVPIFSGTIMYVVFLAGL